MTIRSDINAMERGAGKAPAAARPDCVLLIGGLLLLTRP
jgi:hypothetical protein